MLKSAGYFVGLLVLLGALAAWWLPTETPTPLAGPLVGASVGTAHAVPNNAASRPVHAALETQEEDSAAHAPSLGSLTSPFRAPRTSPAPRPVGTVAPPYRLYLIDQSFLI